MSDITDELLRKIEGLDVHRYFKEPICMTQVSKDLRGEIGVAEQEVQSCGDPPCRTLKALVEAKLEVVGHWLCDRTPGLDGTIAAKMVLAHLGHGGQRGYHLGSFEWFGAGSQLRGCLAGVTNAGTHRDPVMSCERCHHPGHMEGRLDAVVVDGDDKECRLLASYMIHFDWGFEVQPTGIRGTLEGVLICPCRG